MDGFYSLNPMKIWYYGHVPSFIWYKSYFRSLDLEIDLLTFKMTLNHEIITRNGYFSLSLASTFFILLVETLQVHMSPYVYVKKSLKIFV